MFRGILREFTLENHFRMCIQFFSVEMNRTGLSQLCHFCKYFCKYYLTGTHDESIMTSAKLV